ncbi:MAG: hypothetical protein E7597_03675 [Ruminococcaceae bacterium]|nr:hypothetical protein [Oscillospiraceae bacterium]
MKLKLNKDWFKSTNFTIIFSAVIATVAAYVSLPSSGIISTFPLAFIFSVISCFVVKDLFYIPTAFFLVTYLFAFFEGSPVGFENILGGYALRVALKTTVMALLGNLAVAVLKDKDRIINKKWLSVFAAGFVAFVAIIVFGYESGTPWGYNEAKREIYNIMEQRFDTDGVNLSTVYASPGGNGYFCDVNIKGEDKVAHIQYRKGMINENVTELYTEKIAASSVLKMTEILRQSFTNDSFEVKCEYIGSYKAKMSLKAPETVSEHLVYTVNIYSEETAKSFANEAKQYFKAVSDSGVLCGNLTINGGVRRKMFYTAKGNPYIPDSYTFGAYNNAIMPNSIE